MTIWLQKSASIEKRTSPLKFDHFRSKIPDFIARIFQQRRELAAAGRDRQTWLASWPQERRGCLEETVEREERRQLVAAGHFSCALPLSTEMADVLSRSFRAATTSENLKFIECDRI